MPGHPDSPGGVDIGELPMFPEPTRTAFSLACNIIRVFTFSVRVAFWRTFEFIVPRFTSNPKPGQKPAVTEFESGAALFAMCSTYGECRETLDSLPAFLADRVNGKAIEVIFERNYPCPTKCKNMQFRVLGYCVTDYYWTGSYSIEYRGSKFDGRYRMVNDPRWGWRREVSEWRWRHEYALLVRSGWALTIRYKVMVRCR